MANSFNWYLEMLYPELSPKEFYRLLFPEGSFQVKGNYNDGKPNGIAIEVSKTETRINRRGREVPVVRRHTITDDLDKIDELCKSYDFCLMPPIGYLGKERVSENGRKCYAIAIDLDHVKVREDGQPEGLMNLLHQAGGNGVGPNAHQRPMPTVIVSSGTGLHLYYIFKEPLTLSFSTIEYLQDLKKKLTWKMWHDSIVDINDPSEVQYEGIWQGFRVVGTKTKSGETTKAFLVGDKVNPDYLAKFIPDFGKHLPKGLEAPKKSRRVSLDQAKVLYPSWYEERIVLGLPPRGYEAKNDLYEWWLRRIKDDVTLHHRYWCVHMLASYALKSGVDYDTLESDALSLIPQFDLLSDSDNNRFTEKDVFAAISVYDNPRAKFHTIEYIAGKSQVEVKRTKRRAKPISRSRNMKSVNDSIKREVEENGQDDPRYRGGAPTKKELILGYAAEHPDANHSEIARALGVSRPTVIKWLRSDSQ